MTTSRESSKDSSHTRKRVELIIERMAMKRACNLLEAAGVSGYTILPALAGYGNERRWNRDNDISSSGGMIVVICVTSGEAMQRIQQELANLLDTHIGIVTVSDVEVMRPARF